MLCLLTVFLFAGKPASVCGCGIPRRTSRGVVDKRDFLPADEGSDCSRDIGEGAHLDWEIALGHGKHSVDIMVKPQITAHDGGSEGQRKERIPCAVGAMRGGNDREPSSERKDDLVF